MWQCFLKTQVACKDKWTIVKKTGNKGTTIHKTAERKVRERKSGLIRRKSDIKLKQAETKT